MTPKRITYSDHALERLRDREITRQSVRWLLARGMRQPAPTFGGAQRWSCRGYLGRSEAELILIEGAQEVHIITVTWLD